MRDINKRKLRMAMIGGGPDAGIGRVHRSAALLDGEYEIVAGAFSSNAAKSKQMGEKLYLDPDRSYGDWREMLEKENSLPGDRRPDVICVITPNHLHFEPANTALELGYHVVMDKPMTMNTKEALALRDTVRKTGKVLALTHAYGSSAMVKVARDFIRQGRLGKITHIMVEYPQGWLHRLVEGENLKAAAWRTDPALAGTGCVGDIGTHSANLSESITGLRVAKVAADLNTMVPGRKSDDDFTALARWEGDVPGSIQASQICTGEGNGLGVRVYGENAGILWRQDDLDYLTVMYQDKPWERWARNTPYANEVSPAAARLNRCYSFHTEGYLEEFANIYYNAAMCIRALESGREPTELDRDFPNVDDGVRGMAFVDAVLESARNNSAWTEVKQY